MHPDSERVDQDLVLTGAGLADAPQLADLRVRAMRESLERIGRFDVDRARNRFLATFNPDDTRHIERSQRRVGFVVVVDQSDHLLLEHLYIDPGHQNLGIGSAVLQYIFNEADALRSTLRVGALRGSDSNRFYLRHGFELVEEAEWDNYYLRVARPPDPA